MRIFIYSDDHVVHAYDANDYEHMIISGNLSMEFNRSGSLTFTVPATNEAHKNEWIKDLKSDICVKNEADDFEWHGRVLNRSVDFLGNCTYTCEGVLGRLNDIVAYPITNSNYYRYTIDGDGNSYTIYNPCPELNVGIGPIFAGLITQYNDRLKVFGDTRYDYYDANSSSKEFRVSYYGNSFRIADKVIIPNANFENMFDYIQSNIITFDRNKPESYDSGSYGYHIEVSRKKEGNKEYDLLILRSNDPKGDYNNGKLSPNFKTSSKALIFGKNLTGFEYKTDYSEVKTAMHFKATLNAQYQGGGDLNKKQDFKTTREYVYPLEDTNGGFNPSVNGNGMVAKYGLIMGHEDLKPFYGDDEYNMAVSSNTNSAIEAAWSTLTTQFRKDAKRRGEVLMRSPTETIVISGSDILDNDDRINFRVNYYVPVISDYHKIKAKYLCTSCTIDLCNINNSVITLGEKQDVTSSSLWPEVCKQPLDNSLDYY